MFIKYCFILKTPTDEEETIMFDINGDGNFNIIDLIRIKKLAAS